MNAFGIEIEVEAPRKRLPNDWDAGLRENILKMISDPASGVVAFPARKGKKLRHRKVSPAEAALVPGPHDARMSNGVRLVATKRRAGPSLVLSLGRTILGAIAIGAVVGGLIAHDRLEAYGAKLLADLNVPAMPTETTGPALQTAMISGAAIVDLAIH